jgi:hypothetical protein
MVLNLFWFFIFCVFQRLLSINIVKSTLQRWVFKVLLFGNFACWVCFCIFVDSMRDSWYFSVSFFSSFLNLMLSCKSLRFLRVGMNTSKKFICICWLLMSWCSCSFWFTRQSIWGHFNGWSRCLYRGWSFQSRIGWFLPLRGSMSLNNFFMCFLNQVSIWILSLLKHSLLLLLLSDGVMSHFG